MRINPFEHAPSEVNFPPFTNVFVASPSIDTIARTKPIDFSIDRHTLASRAGSQDRSPTAASNSSHCGLRSRSPRQARPRVAKQLFAHREKGVSRAVAAAAGWPTPACNATRSCHSAPGVVRTGSAPPLSMSASSGARTEHGATLQAREPPTPPPFVMASAFTDNQDIGPASSALPESTPERVPSSMEGTTACHAASHQIDGVAPMVSPIQACASSQDDASEAMADAFPGPVGLDRPLLHPVRSEPMLNSSRARRRVDFAQALGGDSTSTDYIEYPSVASGQPSTHAPEAKQSVKLRHSPSAPAIGRGRPHSMATCGHGGDHVARNSGEQSFATPMHQPSEEYLRLEALRHELLRPPTYEFTQYLRSLMQYAPLLRLPRMLAMLRRVGLPSPDGLPA